MSKRAEPNQISVTRETYAKLSRDLPRTHRGAIRPRALKDRMDVFINAALDQAERES